MKKSRMRTLNEIVKQIIMFGSFVCLFALSNPLVKEAEGQQTIIYEEATKNELILQNILNVLSREVDRLESELSSSSKGRAQDLPRGLTAFFASKECPDSWGPVREAEGRYLVGMPEGGTLRAKVGKALTDGENRSTGAHQHEYLSMRIGGDGGDVANAAGFRREQATARTGPSSGYDGATAGVPETNAPYVQLIVCKVE